MLSCSSSDDKNIGGEKISNAIKNGDDIYYEDATISGDVNLIDLNNAVKAAPSQMTVYIKGALVFKNCTFKGMLIAALKDNAKNTYNTIFLKNLYFENCTFNDDVNLEGAAINGFCNFLNCTFNKEALFNRITFNQNAAFTKCVFQQTGGFQGCTFMNNAYFNEAHFGKACFFQNSYMYREFTFNLVMSDAYTDFSNTSFYSTIHCNYAQFHKDVIFGGASFRGRTEFIGSKFTNTDYTGGIFYGITLFDKSEFSGNLLLKDAKFLHSKPSTNGCKAGNVDLTGAQVAGTNAFTDF
jgi:hypothetical protein